MNKNIKSAIGLVLIFVLVSLGGTLFSKIQDKCAGDTKASQSETKMIFAMDTYIELTAYGKNSQKALDEAEKEIYRLDQLLSTGKEESEVSLLNRNKQGIVSEDTQLLLKASIELYQESKGIFDITIYPVMRAWGFTNQNYTIPEKEQLEKLMEHVDASQLDFDENTHMLTFQNKEIEIDFGGIAKGYTSEKIKQIYIENQITGGIINLGGNVQTVGKKKDGEYWKVGIKTPDPNLWKENYVGYLSSNDKAIITSGGYERYFEKDGIQYHHMIDPRTGYPAQNDLLSVTIVCDDGTVGDGLSTTLFIMGLEDALDYWKSSSHQFDAIFLTEDGDVYITPALESAYHSQYPYTVIPEI